MTNIIKNKELSAKRGISSIIGTLIMVAVVAAIGSVIMFQGLNGINDFNYYISFLTGTKNSSYENLVIEHVRFDPVSNDLELWIRNTGTVEAKIAKINMVRIDNQEIIINDNPDQIISIGELGSMDIPQAIAVWQGTPYETAQYRISLITSSGNSFETTAVPFNT